MLKSPRICYFSHNMYSLNNRNGGKYFAILVPMLPVWTMMLFVTSLPQLVYHNYSASKFILNPSIRWNFTSKIWKTYTTLAKLAGLLETSYCPTRWNSTFLICFSWYTPSILISTCGIRLVLGTWVQPPKFLICWVLGLLNLI